MSFNKEHFISEYLKRIGYHGDTTPSQSTLRQLQIQHIHHIPFENLDLLTDAFTPNLEQEYLFDKIVTRRRGGVCYVLPDEQGILTGDTLFAHGYGRTDFADGKIQ